MADLVVKHEEGSRFRATDGEYTIFAGKGEENHENDSMYPGEMFIAALGMCVGSMVRGFLKTREMPYEGMEIELDYESEDSPDRVGSVDIVIHLPEALPEKYEPILKKAAGNCYVKQSIQHGIDFDVSLEK